MSWSFFQVQDEWNFLAGIPLARKSQREKKYIQFDLFSYYFVGSLKNVMWTDVNTKKFGKTLIIATTLAYQKSIKIWMFHYVIRSLFWLFAVFFAMHLSLY